MSPFPYNHHINNFGLPSKQISRSQLQTKALRLQVPHLFHDSRRPKRPRRFHSLPHRSPLAIIIMSNDPTDTSNSFSDSQSGEFFHNTIELPVVVRDETFSTDDSTSWIETSRYIEVPPEGSSQFSDDGPGTPENSRDINFRINRRVNPDSPSQQRYRYRAANNSGSSDMDPTQVHGHILHTGSPNNSGDFVDDAPSFLNDSGHTAPMELASQLYGDNVSFDPSLVGVSRFEPGNDSESRSRDMSQTQIYGQPGDLSGGNQTGLLSFKSADDSGGTADMSLQTEKQSSLDISIGDVSRPYIGDTSGASNSSRGRVEVKRHEGNQATTSVSKPVQTSTSAVADVGSRRGSQTSTAGAQSDRENASPGQANRSKRSGSATSRKTHKSNLSEFSGEIAGYDFSQTLFNARNALSNTQNLLAISEATLKTTREDLSETRNDLKEVRKELKEVAAKWEAERKEIASKWEEDRKEGAQKLWTKEAEWKEEKKEISAKWETREAEWKEEKKEISAKWETREVEWKEEKKEISAKWETREAEWKEERKELRDDIKELRRQLDELRKSRGQ
ncbi:hypothetical protein VKT23_010297 [Stygiomarasmius scandens]|uniref:Uncharacterized protein n=1 Tax=Marasmiellus scandens TaxID=2682957 RepID=A0ABR1JH16_9AGAR